jgi:hypothetical protein
MPSHWTHCEQHSCHSLQWTTVHVILPVPVDTVGSSGGAGGGWCWEPDPCVCCSREPRSWLLILFVNGHFFPSPEHRISAHCPSGTSERWPRLSQLTESVHWGRGSPACDLPPHCYSMSSYPRPPPNVPHVLPWPLCKIANLWLCIRYPGHGIS